jgi:nucleotide-binding universal stress UspA family protein
VARTRADDDAEGMTPTTATPPGTVVVAYDASHHADQALRWAAEQAVLENRTLTIAHAVTPVTAMELASLATANLVPEDIREAVREAGRSIVSEARARVLADHPALDVATDVVEGDARQMLVRLSTDADCLVLGSRGRGRVASLLLGSVSIAATRNAVCPVIVVRPHHPGKVRRGVLVGTDCSDQSGPTLEYAYREASLRQLPLTVVYCVSYADVADLRTGFVADDVTDLDQHRRILAESVAGMAEKFPDVAVRLRLGRGPVDRCLITAGADMDLVVVGHHHGAAVGDVIGLGAYAAAVVEGASCPVAVVGQRRTKVSNHV